jgi:hypothetical protein
MQKLQLLLSDKKEILKKLQKRLTIVGWIRVVIFLAITYFFLQYFILESGSKSHLYLSILASAIF